MPRVLESAQSPRGIAQPRRRIAAGRPADAYVADLAGLGADTKVHLVSYPGSSVLDFLRPKPSSQPASASLTDAATGLVRGVVRDVIEHGEHNMTGAKAMWLGDWRF